MRLLVVEDDPMIGDSMQRGLRKSGLAVDWVRDGKDAELALGNGVYDLMILDLGLPRKGGLELLSQLRGQGNDLPVLIVTARDAVEDKVAGLNSGADDYAALKAMEAQASRAAKYQREIKDQIAAVQGAARRPEEARKLGVDVKDPEAILGKIAELKSESARWDNWPQHSDLVTKTRGEAPAPDLSLTPDQPKAEAPKPAQQGMDLGLKGDALRAPERGAGSGEPTELERSANEAADRANQVPLFSKNTADHPAPTFYEEGQPLFNREEYKLKSASEDIQKTVKTLTDKIPTLKGKVEVVKSETDLPDHLKSEVKSRGFEGTVEGVFDPKDGKVYVVSNNIFGANRVEQVLRHELTHRGIRNVLGDKVKPVFQQIYKQFENTKEMSKVITDYDLNTDKEGGKLTAVDEFIARHGEQYQKQPVIQRMISMIRHELRKMGFSIKWSDKDIMNLAGAALKSEGMGEEIRFSTKGKESKSNLNPFQREQVKTPEFKRWFGESKVVDENGEPLIAYHGSPTMKDIAEFKNGSIEKGDFGPAIYFDESRFVAQHFTGEGRPDQVGEFYIKANNPLDFTKGNKAVAKQLEPLIGSMEANHRKVYDRWANGEIDVKNAYRFLANSFTDMKGPKEFNEKLQSIGIDGIIDYGTSGVSEGSKQIAVFDPSQIKSATGNTGEFNPKNKDIRFSRKNAEEDEYNHLQKIPRSQLTPEQVEQLKKKFGKVRN